MPPRSSNFSVTLSVKDQAAASRAKFGDDGRKAIAGVETAARRNSAEFKRLQRSQRELTTGMQGRGLPEASDRSAGRCRRWGRPGSRRVCSGKIE